MQANLTRVRYERQTDGSLVSVRSFVAGTNIVSVQIEQNLSVSVRQFTGDNASLGAALATQSASNLAQAKRLAKSMLKHLGVQFTDETRNTLESALELTDSSETSDSEVAQVAAASN